jgi:hypothetical protein
VGGRRGGLVFRIQARMRDGFRIRLVRLNQRRARSDVMRFAGRHSADLARPTRDPGRMEVCASEVGFLNSGANPHGFSNPTGAFESAQDGLGC